MARILALTVAVIGTAAALLAGTTTPEIDASTGAAAIALLAGGVLVLRGRRAK